MVPRLRWGRWLIYSKERFPLPTYLLLVGGLGASGALLEGGAWRWDTVAYSFPGILIFFALLRLMDELKDYRKDLVAHAERPLPRGLLSVEEVRRTIQAIAVGMMLYGALGAYVLNPIAGLNYVVLTVYLWLMYREFYIGPWLEERQLLYAGSHQLVLVPLCTFAVFSASPELYADPRPYLFGSLVLGSFFSYEVCRKLDPEAHPLLRTYRLLYGASGSFLIVAVASGVAAWSAARLGVQAVVLPAGALLLASFVLFVRRKYKVVEAVASLSLALHVWAIALMGVLQ